MKKNLFVIGILPLLFTLGACNNETPQSEEEKIKAKLYEEVTLQENLEVDGKANFTTQEENDFINLINTRLNDEIVRIQGHIYSRTDYAKEDRNHYVRNIYTEANYYADYLLTVKREYEALTKIGAVKYTESGENNYYYGSLPEYEMKYEVKTYQNPDNNTAVRYYYADSSYAIGSWSEQEKKEAFYKSSYSNFSKLQFYSGSSLSSFTIYEVGDLYLLDYTLHSMKDYDTYSFETINQYIVYVNKEGYIQSLSSFHTGTRYLKINGEYELLYRAEHDYRRFHFTYGERVDSDKSALHIVEKEFNKGVFESFEFNVTSLAGVDHLEYSGLSATSIGKSSVYGETYIYSGVEGQTYTMKFTFTVKYTNSLYVPSKSMNIAPMYDITSTAAEHIVQRSNNSLSFKYTLEVDGKTYNYMDFYFGMQLTLDEEGTITVKSSKLSLYWANS